MDPTQLMPQETPSQFVPPPTSPSEAPVVSPEVNPMDTGMADPMAGQFVGPEHMKQLDDLLGKVQGKMGEYTSQKFVGDNTNNATKQKLLGEVLMSLQKAGVNVNDQAEVAAYLDKLREFNPDIADLLESFLEKIIGSEFDNDLGGEDDFSKIPGVTEEELPPVPPQEGSQQKPPKYENLSKTVRERI